MMCVLLFVLHVCMLREYEGDGFYHSSVIILSLSLYWNFLNNIK